MALTQVTSLKRTNGKQQTTKPAAKAAASKPAAAPAAVPVEQKQTHQIESLVVDPDLQQRAGGVDEKVVAEYAADLLDGVRLPPIKAVQINEKGDLFGALLVWDGFQRIAASTKAVMSDIEVMVRPGTYEDAVWLSCSANKAHGLRRRPEDKRKAIGSALKLTRTQKMSDRQIAEHCGGSPSLVGMIRKEMVEKGEIEAVTERIGAGGKIINVSKETVAQKSAAGKKSAGARQAAAPAKPGKPAPAASNPDDEPIDDAEVAESLGVQAESAPKGKAATAAPKAAAVTAPVTDGIMLDANDASVPEELQDVFKHVDEFHGLKRAIDRMAGMLKALSETDAGVFIDPASIVLLEGIAEEVLAATPYVVNAEMPLGWEPTFADKITHNTEKLGK